MTKDQILKSFDNLKPVEKMELCLELQLKIMKETGIDKSNRILVEEFEEIIKRLRHEK